MYSAYKLNKQGDNIQPCWTCFPILNQSLFCCSVVQSCLTLCDPMDCKYTRLPWLYLNFTFTTRYIHNWVSFQLWPSLFIISGSISLLSSILYTFWPGGLIFQCHIFLSFHTVHGALLAGITGMVSNSLLQWTMLCQNAPLWTTHLEWSCMAWLVAWLT